MFMCGESTREPLNGNHGTSSAEDNSLIEGFNYSLNKLTVLTVQGTKFTGRAVQHYSECRFKKSCPSDSNRNAQNTRFIPGIRAGEYADEYAEG
jgi:hypothetical protein